MTLRRPDRARTAILTTEQAAVADRYAGDAGISIDSLIAAAGSQVANAAKTLNPDRVLVLAGPGNNGADGLAAARRLQRDGLDVMVVHAETGRQLVDRAAEFRDAIRELVDDRPRRPVIIDALIGAGLNRDLGEALTALVGFINTAPAAVLSVDVPSGLNGDDGRSRPVAVRADLTVTFFRKKPAHLLMPGRDYCGRVIVTQIGIPEAVVGDLGIRLWENDPVLWAMPERTSTGNKYDAGHCLVVSGGRWNTGASRLAALAALRIGAGAVTIVGPPPALDVHAAHVTEIMLAPATTPTELETAIALRRASAIIIGPALGLKPGSRELVRTALASPAPVVLDADGLSCWADDPDTLLALTSQRSAPVVMTPHAAEFARVFSTIQLTDKVTAARLAAQRSGAIVVLKGADTVVAAPNSDAIINTNAPPSLATAGSGDVLAGIIGGLLSQGLSGFDAAAAGVWQHGTAAQRSPRNLIAGDLIDALAQHRAHS